MAPHAKQLNPSLDIVLQPRPKLARHFAFEEIEAIIGTADGGRLLNDLSMVPIEGVVSTGWLGDRTSNSRDSAAACLIPYARPDDVRGQALIAELLQHDGIVRSRQRKSRRPGSPRRAD